LRNALPVIPQGRPRTGRQRTEGGAQAPFTFGKRFADEAYAVEGLVPELGAAFLCVDLGLTLEPRPDHAVYLDNWLKVLKADKKAIFTAASAAAKATDYLARLQTTEITEAAA
jgi:antirestriction protein ArdC